MDDDERLQGEQWDPPPTQYTDLDPEEADARSEADSVVHTMDRIEDALWTHVHPAALHQCALAVGGAMMWRARHSTASSGHSHGGERHG